MTKNPFLTLRKKFPQIVFMDEQGESYLDSASTSLKMDIAIDAIKTFYETGVSNVHRGEHDLSLKATHSYEKAREKVADFINAQAQEIIFTRNTTEGLNFLASSLGPLLKEGDEILLTQMEHHSNFLPWKILAEKQNLKLRIAKVDSEGALDRESFKELLNSKTKIVTLTHISNVTGVLNPLDKILPLVRKTPAVLILDSAQAISCIPIDVKKLDCDFLVFSGHKIFSPAGVGVLYAKSSLLDQLSLYQTGGGTITKVEEKQTDWASPPACFEAGTPFIEGAIALGEVLSFFKQELDFKEILKWEKNLVSQAESLLAEIPGLKVIGPKNNRSNILSFVIEGMHCSDLAHILTKEKLALRSGHHCCMPLMSALKLKSGTVRASFSIYNREEDIYQLKKALQTAQKILQA